MFDDEADYLDGRTRDGGQFQQFDQVEISLYA
jgi:hypothetical protein